jgi:hypothetical protein
MGISAIWKKKIEPALQAAEHSKLVYEIVNALGLDSPMSAFVGWLPTATSLGITIYSSLPLWAVVPIAALVFFLFAVGANRIHLIRRRHLAAASVSDTTGVLVSDNTEIPSNGWPTRKRLIPLMIAIFSVCSGIGLGYRRENRRLHPLRSPMRLPRLLFLM